IFQVKPAPDRAGWTRDQISQYKLSDNVLYVNCALTRPYCETKKAKAQRERLVGLAQADKRTFRCVGILGVKKKISDHRNKDCNDCYVRVPMPTNAETTLRRHWAPQQPLFGAAGVSRV